MTGAMYVSDWLAVSRVWGLSRVDGNKETLRWLTSRLLCNKDPTNHMGEDDYGKEFPACFKWGLTTTAKQHKQNSNIIESSQEENTTDFLLRHEEKYSVVSLKVTLTSSLAIITTDSGLNRQAGMYLSSAVQWECSCGSLASWRKDIWTRTINADPERTERELK